MSATQTHWKTVFLNSKLPGEEEYLLERYINICSTKLRTETGVSGLACSATYQPAMS